MKKILQNLSCSLLFLLIAQIATAQVTIGTSTTTDKYPFNYFFGYGRDAMIYTASEMNTATTGGTITTISWYSDITSGWVTGPTVIYLKAVGTTTATTNTTWAATITGATSVYSGTPTWVNGWNSIDITDFPIAANQNLQIMVECNYGAGGTSPSSGNSIRYSAGGTNSHAYWYADNTAPAGNASVTGGRNTNRGNIILGGLVPVAVPGCATLSAPANNATSVALNTPLTWAAPSSGSTPTNYKVYLGTVNPPTTLATTTTGLTYTPSGQTYSTAYYWYVVPTNSTGDATGCNSNIFSYTTTAPPPPPVNDECVNAITLVCNGTAISGTTVNSVSEAALPGACASLYGVWYKFTGNGSTVTLTSVAGSGYDHELDVFSGSCGALTSIVCKDDAGAAGTETYTLATVAGTQYYVYVAHYSTSSTATGTFNIGMTCISCAAPTAVAVNTVTTTTANITWTGTGSYVVEYGPTGFTPGTGAAAGSGSSFIALGTTSPVALSGLIPATNYDIYVRQNCTSAGNGYSTNATGTFRTSALPPANDNCSNATAFPVIPVNGTCITLSNQTTDGATASGVTPTGACTSNSGTPDDDVWYSFVASGTVMDLSFTWVSGATDIYWQVYSGSCGSAMTSLFCSDLEAGGSLTGLILGQTYYIRLYTYGSAVSTVQNICLKATPMTYVSSTAAQPAAATASVTAGTTDAAILRTVVVVLNANNPLAVTQLNFSTNGTTSVADLTNAKVYYTGTSTGFSNTTLFGNVVANPNGTFSVTGNQLLTGASGSNTSNYFWLAYDVACGAVPANVIDAELSSIVVGGNTVIPTASAPTGTRAITALYSSARTDGNSTTSINPGTLNNQMVYVNVTGSAACPGTVSNVQFTVSGTASAADIASAKCYYTTTATFSTANPYGSAVPSPGAGAINFTGSQLLAGGSNYFWLVYDVNCAATVGNSINGDVVSVTVNGNAINPTGTAAAANSIVVAASYNTVANGDWNNPATWTCGSIPLTSSTAVVINHNISVTTTGNVAGNVTIATGASLTVSSGNLTLGNNGGDKIAFVDNGTLTVSGGTFNVNGSMSFPSGSVLNQTGGDIIEDGNAAGVTANSVASSTYLVSFVPSNLTSVNLTGGTFTIVDPHAASAAANYVLYVNGSTIGALNVTKNHTFRFGNGVSTDAGGNSTYGFRTNFWQSSTGLPIGNLIVEGPTGTNRFVTSSFQVAVLGDITVNAGGEIRMGNIYTNGNILVNTGGIMTLTSASTYPALWLAKVNYNPTVDATFEILDNPLPQTISGGGTFRNAATSATASVSLLNIQNSSAAGVTLAVPFSVSGTLNMINGRINTSATNLLTVGINGTTTGTITRTAGMIVGPVKKWNAAATGSTVFPVGDGVNYKPATINFTTAPTAGTLTVNFSSAAPVFGNATTLTESAAVPPINVNKLSKQGSWFVDAGDGLTGGAYTASFTGNGATDIIDYTRTVLVKRPSSGGDWALENTYAATTGSNNAPVASRTGLTSFSEFAIGGELNIALPLSLQYFTGAKRTAGNLLDWKITCTSGVTITLERSADKVNFKSLNAQSATADRCLTPFSYTDAQPLAGSNYYRLKLTSADGDSKYSNIVLLINKDKGFEFVNLVPNPVQHSAVLNMSSAKAGKIELSVSDVTGKVVMKQSASVTAGSNQLTMNFANLAAGTYQIFAVNEDGEIKTTRFVKY